MSIPDRWLITYEYGKPFIVGNGWNYGDYNGQVIAISLAKHKQSIAELEANCDANMKALSNINIRVINGIVSDNIKAVEQAKEEVLTELGIQLCEAAATPFSGGFVHAETIVGIIKAIRNSGKKDKGEGE